MCFVWLADRVHPERPVIVAANRDEAWDRPSAPPRIHVAPEAPAGARGPDILAPVDLRSGGTWIGWNGDGLFVAITERPAGTPDPTLPSRGLLTLRALAARSASDAADFVSRIVHRQRTNPFQIVAADGVDTLAVVHDGGWPPEIRSLEPGLHVLTNQGDPDTILYDTIEKRYPAEVALPGADTSTEAGADTEDLLRDRLIRIVTDRSIRDSEGRSVVKAGQERGTVSSTILLGGHGSRSTRVAHAADAPWPRDFLSCDELAERLRPSASKED